MILVTGAAGFIGFHVTRRLLSEGVHVVGLDNMNDYYDVSLKEARLAELLSKTDEDHFHFEKIDLADRDAMKTLFDRYSFDQVIHLGAQAGVRYSLSHPYTYVDSNLDGFVTILEESHRHNVSHLLYASSSSVYGANRKIPFSTEDPVEQPISLYAATKRANELLAYSYSHLYDLRTTGMRLFTVYGPWGRPDMALFKFTRAILEGRPIDIFNQGQMKRDFTFIDDLVEMIIRLSRREERATRYSIWNLGTGQPRGLLEMIEILEKSLDKESVKNWLPLQPGDMLETWADTTTLEKAIGPLPRTSLQTGITQFVEWYLRFYSRTNL